MNKVHNIDFLNNDLPNKSANLIIADPPYYKTKGQFDFIWKTFDDYLKDVEKWCLECKRILADNGTLFWYGGSKNIAYAQIIFDKHFNLINNITWNKGSFMGLEESEGLRSFAPCTERILMYELRGQKTGGEIIFEQFLKPKNPFSKYLKIEFKNAKVTNKEIAKLFPSRTGGLTGCVSNWLNGDNVITEEQYLKIRKFLENKFLLKPYEELRKEYEELRKEYEELRKEYEELRRPFNNVFNLQEVLNFSNEQAKTGAKYDHDTVKPEKLTRSLILTCSRENDLVVVPFAGSGTECAMSAKEKRNFMAYEINEKYAKMAQARANKILKQPTLF
jgi:site-specific DNA-methyltransferase (adenine-specific)